MKRENTNRTCVAHSFLNIVLWRIMFTHTHKINLVIVFGDN